MKNRLQTFTLFLLALGFTFSSCKKNDSVTDPIDGQISSKILAAFPTYIALPNLTDLKIKASELNDAVVSFNSSPSQDGLVTIQQKWYAARVSWEQSESFLFGPVASLGLDPSIDSWPVNFIDIDSVINNNSTYSDAFMDSLNETLKGFHPIEYLVFGQNGNRQFSELNAKQKNYLAALSSHIKRVTARMVEEWDPTQGNFAAQLALAGTANSQYATQKDAILEIANAMIGIVDEVGHGKIEEPFAAKNPSLEESPFAKNSWTDFKNNITGVKNVYTGGYSTKGTSLSAFVKQYNKSLDLKIEQKIDQCIANLAGYTTPFGEAINTQPGAIQSTQGLLSDLQKTLEEELIPLIEQKVN